MNTLHIKSFQWMLVPYKDYELLASGAASIRAGFAEAASIQSTYFDPGTTSEAERIRSILRLLDTDFPTIEQVRKLLPQIEQGPGIYQFESDEEIWHIRNQTVPDWDNPFGRFQWILLTQAEQAWNPVHVVESMQSALAPFAFLNGEHSREQINENLHDNQEGLSVLQKLISANLIEEREQHNFSVLDIPEFLFLGHSGLLVRSGEDLLAIDPAIVPSTRALADRNLPIDTILNRVNAILITHNHWDHLYYLTLARLRRDMRIIVPRISHPSFPNAPMATYLRSLGFTQVEEREAGEVITLGEITLRLFPFYGEPFGLHSRFDAFTYYIHFGENTLYGSVDACYDEAGDMEKTIEQVAELDPIDFFLFGSSGQRHEPAYTGGGLRYFSNELIKRPDLVRYHPDHNDALRWAEKLQPRALIPYAQFLFQGKKSPNVQMSSLIKNNDIYLGEIPDRHIPWGEELCTIASTVQRPLYLLQPMQGIVT